MKNFLLFWKLILVVGTGFFLGSCSIQTDVQINTDGSGAVKTQLFWKPAVNLYWKDLRELDPSLPATVLDQKSLQQSLEQRADGTNPIIIEPRANVGADEAALSFRVPDTAKLNGNAGLDLFKITKTAQGSRLTLTLDRTTLRHWLSLTTYGNSPAIASIFPADGQQTQADLRSNLIYALGSYTTDAPALVDASQVEIKLHLPRSATHVEGGKLIDKNLVIGEWPLVEVLALDQPIKLVVDY